MLTRATPTMSDRKTHRATKTERKRAVRKVREFALKQKGKGISERLWRAMTPKEAGR
jgi:hypothetical protein